MATATLTDTAPEPVTQAVLSTIPRFRSRVWMWLSIPTAILAIAGSIIGLADARIYENLTATFRPQARAQDIANLAIAPLMVCAAILALRGSLRAYLVWLGVVAFTVYNYVIYTFSVPFGPLFAVWVAVLGLSLFSLIGGLHALDGDEVAARYASRRVVITSALFLLVVAGLFLLLWLSEDVPALIVGSTPRSVVDMGLPTNPVHILDYVFFLPAALVTGIGLLRGSHFSYLTGPAFVVFLVLTCAPILITPLLQASANLSIGLIVGIGMLALTLSTVLVILLSSVKTRIGVLKSD